MLASSPETWAVSVADKLHNVCSMNRDITEGRNIWQYFLQDKKTTIEHYIRYTREMKKRWRHPLVDELERAVKTLAGISGC